MHAIQFVWISDAVHFLWKMCDGIRTDLNYHIVLYRQCHIVHILQQAISYYAAEKRTSISSMHMTSNFAV